ncbi:MAG: ABC transporter permease [Acidobacteriia bacterium]|nr:ABC transporter permease [Terriglobia bacterium]
MREWWSKIRQILERRRGLDDDLGEEMRSHLDFLIEENLSRGMPPDEARAAARREFGNPMSTRERAREAWQSPGVETILQDMRYGLRGIRKSPSFALVVIVTLALGIAANIAIFSVVHAVLLRPLPYPAGERLVWLGESTEDASGISVTWLNFQHWRGENHSFENMAGFETTDLTLTGRGEAVLTHAMVVTNTFFHLTGARPLMGRLFTEADDRPGAALTVLVTSEFWSKTLGGDPKAVGATLALNGKAYQVIGVLAPGPKFLSRPGDFYLPLGISAGNIVNRSQHASMRVLGLLKPGATIANARADLDAIMKRLALADPGPENDHRTFAEYLSEVRVGDVRQTLWMLMGAVGLVLILACANVASLLLVRSTARSREIAIRTAIGARRTRIARQLLTENLVIAALGGGLGLLLAGVCLRTLALLGPGSIPRLGEAGIDVPVLIFAAAVTVMVALLAGLAPVFSAGRVDLTVALKEGSAASGASRRGHFFRNALITAEIAITLVLSFASGLLIRSLMIAQNAYPGFDSDHLLALELQLPESGYASDEAARQFYGRLMEDLRGEPGVETVGAVNCPPSAGDCGDWWYSILEQPAPARGNVPLSLFNTADSAYFRAMRMRLVAGRGFTDADRQGGPRVAVINEEIARKWWAAPQFALGHQIKIGGPYMEGPVCEIVGVVANVSQMGLDTKPMPEIYYAFPQRGEHAMVVMIRTAGDSAALIPTVRRCVAALDPNLPIQSLRPFETWLEAPLAQRRFSTLLLGLFAALAMILAAVGIYGVLNYWVSVRQKEIAVRLALGAQRSAILRWAGSHAMRLAVVGIALGAFGAWGASRWLGSLVFGVSAQDPGMMLVAVAAVLAIAALASSVPLWRATRVDAVRHLHDA